MFEVVYVDEDNRIEYGLTHSQAVERAVRYCGNNVPAILPDQTRLYGRGDGTTSVIVRPSLQWPVLSQQQEGN